MLCSCLSGTFPLSLYPPACLYPSLPACPPAGTGLHPAALTLTGRAGTAGQPRADSNGHPVDGDVARGRFPAWGAQGAGQVAGARGTPRAQHSAVVPHGVLKRGRQAKMGIPAARQHPALPFDLQGLEEASRLYFGESNVEGMLAVRGAPSCLPVCHSGVRTLLLRPHLNLEACGWVHASRCCCRCMR
jgi:hypothetical protein